MGIQRIFSSRRRRALGVLVGGMVVLGVLNACTATPIGPRVALFGDSLSAESRLAFAGALSARDLPLDSWTWGGTAPCDWMEKFLQEVQPGRYSHVFILFSANRWTRCMAGPDGQPVNDDEAVRRFAVSVGGMIDRATKAGSQVRIVLAPPFATDTAKNRAANDLRRRIIDEVYSPLARRYAGQGVATVDAADVLGKTFRLYDTCTPSERSQCGPNGTIKIRNADGVHLCPVVGRNQWECAVYNAGGTRLAALMASTV